MQRNGNLNSVMVSGNHSKNGASLKKLVVLVVTVCISVSLWGQETVTPLRWEMLKTGATNGIKKFQFIVGEIYFYGSDNYYKNLESKLDTKIQVNKEQAVYWYTKAAEQGEKEAQFKLGTCYYLGEGVTKDITKFVYWNTKAAEQGNAQAQLLLGMYYGSEENEEGKDYTQAVYWFQKAAEQGDEDAQYYLGNCYHRGNGVTKDYTQAVYWYRKAAEQGYAKAQFELGNCYFRGITKDDTQVVYWFQKAAEQGYAEAQCILGLFYSVGKGGVVKDDMQAMFWMRKAAEQGNEKAQYLLGTCYQNGNNGVTTDYTQAVHWYRKAAEQGYAKARYKLGVCYTEGKGIVKDVNEGIYWLTKAAGQGEEDARNYLGYLETLSNKSVFRLNDMVLLDKPIFDFGKVSLDTEYSATFKFKNESKNDMILQNVTTSCDGVTTPYWTMPPIRPAEFGIIEVKYKPTEICSSVQAITVSSNFGKYKLYIKADITSDNE